MNQRKGVLKCKWLPQQGGDLRKKKQPKFKLITVLRLEELFASTKLAEGEELPIVGGKNYYCPLPHQVA